MTRRQEDDPRRTGDVERVRGSDDDTRDGFLERDTGDTLRETDSRDGSPESETRDGFRQADSLDGFLASETQDESPGTEAMLSSSPEGETAFACRRCNIELSRVADECPECGYDPAGTTRDVAAVILAFGVVLTVAVPPAGVFALFVGVVLVGWSFLRTPAGRVT